MPVYFISRHPGALDWLNARSVRIDRHIAHLDGIRFADGDVVIGTLPVHLAAAVCAQGARFINLSVHVPPAARGRELSHQELDAFGAHLEEFRVDRVGGYA